MACLFKHTDALGARDEIKIIGDEQMDKIKTISKEQKLALMVREV